MLHISAYLPIRHWWCLCVNHVCLCTSCMHVLITHFLAYFLDTNCPEISGTVLKLAERKDKSFLETLYSDKFRRGSTETIVTIDYGTTYCSVYFTLYPKEEVLPLTLDQSGSIRVPNCLLFSNGGRLMKFGVEASDAYADIDKEDRKNFYYFEHVKRFFKHQV